MRWALAALLCASSVAAQAGPSYEAPTDAQLAKRLRKIHKRAKEPVARMEPVSALFVGAPYTLGPLGEGHDGEFDRDPLIRFDTFDCTTLVETAMALSLEADPAAAAATMQKIRYREGKVGFAARNHFPELDWIPQNVWAGYLRDVTREVAGDKTLELGKVVSKRQWYAHMSTASVEGRFSAEERLRRLPRLQALGLAFEDQRATIAVLPMEDLPRALARLPSGTIANLVRADLPDKPVLVSHQVLLIQKESDGPWFVRHAAFGKSVEDVPALEYFYRYFNSKWPLVGLNLNVLRDPRNPLAR
jgi:hypothetical protein